MKKIVFLLAMTLAFGLPTHAKKKKVVTPTEKKAPVSKVYSTYNTKRTTGSFRFRTLF